MGEKEACAHDTRQPYWHGYIVDTGHGLNHLLILPEHPFSPAGATRKKVAPSLFWIFY